MDIDYLRKNKIISQNGLMINPHFSRKVANGNKWALDQVALISAATAFLETNDLKAKIHCICNNITAQPTCHVCGSETSLQYHKDIKGYKFSKCCSIKCSTKLRDEEKIHNTRKQTNQARYGAENVMSLEESKFKIQETNTVKYGRDYPSQTHISEEALKKLNNSRWLLQHHTTKNASQIATELGINVTTVIRKLQEFNIPRYYTTISIGEKELVSWLKSLDVCVEENNRSIISPQELDIFLPEYNIAIEYCGLYWHADIHERIDNNYHKRKYDKCKNQGIQLLTIFEDEWHLNQEKTKSKIKSLLGKDDRQKIHARKTRVVSIDSKTKIKFLNANHIQGSGPGSINIGLVTTETNTLVACMSFIKKSNNVYYLNRYATSHRVVGGFSKLLNYFKQNYEWNQIVSFADLRWSTGELYKTTGWDLDVIIPPDYSYVTKNNTRSHKFNFRRKRLQNILENFDPNLSEKENCDNHGIMRIWDCGKMRFVINNEE